MAGQFDTEGLQEVASFPKNKAALVVGVNGSNTNTTRRFSVPLSYLTGLFIFSLVWLLGHGTVCVRFIQNTSVPLYLECIQAYT